MWQTASSARVARVSRISAENIAMHLGTEKPHKSIAGLRNLITTTLDNPDCVDWTQVTLAKDRDDPTMVVMILKAYFPIASDKDVYHYKDARNTVVATVEEIRKQIWFDRTDSDKIKTTKAFAFVKVGVDESKSPYWLNTEAHNYCIFSVSLKFPRSCSAYGLSRDTHACSSVAESVSTGLASAASSASSYAAAVKTATAPVLASLPAPATELKDVWESSGDESEDEFVAAMLKSRLRV